VHRDCHPAACRQTERGRKMIGETEIEIAVERAIDRLDRAFMAGKLTQSEYDREVGIVDKWAAQQYDAAKPAPFKTDRNET